MKLHITKDGPLTINPEEDTVITVDENVEALIIEQGKGEFSVTITLKDNAKLKYYSLTMGKTKRTATLANDASLEWVDVALSGATAHVTSTLGKGANAEFRSVFLGKDEERYDIRSAMIHEGDHSTSNMLTRAVLKGKSYGKYEGLINIHKDAKGCDAYQKEDTLLLSEDARMDAAPNLEISNEDVRCSHGVSLSRVDAEKLFYFQARGIPKENAITIIVQGFFDEVLHMMGEHGKELRAKVMEAL